MRGISGIERDADAQRALRFGARVEYPRYRASWVEDGRPVCLSVGPHCVDTAWPWWQPGGIWDFMKGTDDETV